MEKKRLKKKPSSEKLKKYSRVGRRSRDAKSLKCINFDLLLKGAPRFVLGERTQQELQCVVGKDVTSEHPSKFVPKELLEDSLTYNYESEFLPLRLDILTYPRDNLLLVYVPDDLRDYDEFILCLSEKAEDRTVASIAMFDKALEEFLARAVYKTITPWKSLGSEREIEEYTEKNNRELFIIEVEASYPIMSRNVHFRFRLAESVIGGYVEMIQTRSLVSHVIKKRINAGIQAASYLSNSSTQTFFKYNRNATTQYVFEYENVKTISPNLKKNIVSFMSTELNSLCDQITVNANINFYANDYVQLIPSAGYIKPPKSSKNVELITFSDFTVAKNKVISSVCWHPILSGTVAIAYSPIASNVTRSGKPKLDHSTTYYGTNTVLIWCTNDELYAKLHLECTKQITCISFCPHNESIIVGTCKTGQIVFWDIANKLDQVEESEILSSNKQRYKIFLSLFMTWMKNIEDKTRVPVTVESDIQYSHGATSTCIQWLPPYCRITKCGKYELIPEHEPETLQFATCALDGSVLFWDLLAKPPSHESHLGVKNRPRRQSSGIVIGTSPFRHLNRVLRPTYKVNCFNDKKLRPLLISCIVTPPINVTYRHASSEVKLKLTDRVAHETIVKRPSPTDVTPDIYCGTCDGYFFRATWDGYDVNPGDNVNYETLVITSIGKYHDGPVTSIQRHPDIRDIYLTVGGKIFAVWKDNLKDKPVFWRKSKLKYLHGTWYTTAFQGIMLSTQDGRKEVWVITVRNDTFYFEQSLSGDMVLGIYVYPFTLDGNDLLGVAHRDGTFGMIFVPGQLKQICYVKESLIILFNREVERKTAFLQWQKTWLENHQDIIQERNAKINIYRQKKLEKQKQLEEKRLTEELLREEEQKRLTHKIKPVPGRYFQYAQEQWRIKQQDNMRKVLLERQRLNPALLEELQRPLKLAKQEEERMQIKLRTKLHNSEKLFHDTVAMLFPDAIKKEPPPPMDPYAGGDAISEKQECLFEYMDDEKKADLIIEENPYLYVLAWRQILQDSSDKRKNQRYLGTVSHKRRHSREKNKRMLDR